MALYRKLPWSLPQAPQHFLLAFLGGLGLFQGAAAQEGGWCSPCADPVESCMGWDGTMMRMYGIDEWCPNGCTCAAEVCYNGVSCSKYGRDGQYKCVTSAGVTLEQTEGEACPPGDTCTCQEPCMREGACASPLACWSPPKADHWDTDKQQAPFMIRGYEDADMATCRPIPCGNGVACGANEVCTTSGGEKVSHQDQCDDCTCRRAFCADDGECMDGEACVAYDTQYGTLEFTRMNLADKCTTLGQCFCKPTCSNGMQCGGVQQCREYKGELLGPTDSCMGAEGSCFCSDPPLPSDSKVCTASMPYNVHKGQFVHDFSPDMTPCMDERDVCTCQTVACRDTMDCISAHTGSLCVLSDGRQTSRTDKNSNQYRVGDRVLVTQGFDIYNLPATVIEMDEWGGLKVLMDSDRSERELSKDMFLFMDPGKCVAKCQWLSHCQDGVDCKYAVSWSEETSVGSVVMGDCNMGMCACLPDTCKMTADCGSGKACLDMYGKMNATAVCSGDGCLCVDDTCAGDDDCAQGSVCTQPWGTPFGESETCYGAEPCKCAVSCASGAGCPSLQRCFDLNDTILGPDEQCDPPGSCVCREISCQRGFECPGDLVCMEDGEMSQHWSPSKFRTRDSMCPEGQACTCKVDICLKSGGMDVGCEWGQVCVSPDPLKPLPIREGEHGICKTKCSNHENTCLSTEDCVFTPPPDQMHYGTEQTILRGMMQGCPQDGYCTCQKRNCGTTADCPFGAACVDELETIRGGAGAPCPDGECTCKFLLCDSTGSCPSGWGCGHPDMNAAESHVDRESPPQQGWPLLEGYESCDYWTTMSRGNCQCYPYCTSSDDCAGYSGTLCVHRGGNSILPGQSCPDGNCVCRALPCETGAGCLGGLTCSPAGMNKLLTKDEECPYPDMGMFFIPKSLKGSCACTPDKMPCGKTSDCEGTHWAKCIRPDGEEAQENHDGMTSYPDEACDSGGCFCMKQCGSSWECSPGMGNQAGLKCMTRENEVVSDTGCHDGSCVCKPSLCAGPKDCEAFETCMDSVYGVLVNKDSECLSGSCVCTAHMQCHKADACMTGFLCVDSSDHTVIPDGEDAYCMEGPCHCAPTCSDSEDCAEGMECNCVAEGKCFCSHPHCERTSSCKLGEGCYILSEQRFIMSKDETCDQRSCSCAPHQCGEDISCHVEGKSCIAPGFAYATAELCKGFKCLCLQTCETHKDCTNSEYAMADPSARCWKLDENRSLYHGERCEGSCVCQSQETFATTTTLRVTSTMTATATTMTETSTETSTMTGTTATMTGTSTETSTMTGTTAGTSTMTGTSTERTSTMTETTTGTFTSTGTEDGEGEQPGGGGDSRRRRTADGKCAYISASLAKDLQAATCGGSSP